MTQSLERLKRRAKSLLKSYRDDDPEALMRFRAYAPQALPDPVHADALHVVAREEGYPSWPRLKARLDSREGSLEDQLGRLRGALHNGHMLMVEALLAEIPDAAARDLGVAAALYDEDAVEAHLRRDPSAAVQVAGTRSPLLHLCGSRLPLQRPELVERGPRIAARLVASGAEVNAGIPAAPGETHQLSPLYFALGHAGNLPLAEWLLEAGADPNDNESLYHATELGHGAGVDLLLRHGARVEGTNALYRALDFNAHEIVRALLRAGGDPNEVNWKGPGYNTLHHAGLRMCDGEMAEVLLAAGADPQALFDGRLPYATALLYGNIAFAEGLASAGAPTEVPPALEPLVAVAQGRSPEGFIDPAKLPDGGAALLSELVHLPGTLDHIRRLVEAGFPWDAPEGEGLTPVQVAGWEGKQETFAYLLSLSPDLSHVNGYGGTLFSTILHGSENCPARAERDHIACMRLALELGVALPRRAPDAATEPAMAAFLADWAERHPGQVIEGGVV